MNKLAAALALTLAACGSQSPAMPTRDPAAPIPVTYYPTPTSAAPPAGLSVAAEATPAPAPATEPTATVAPADTPAPLATETPAPQPQATTETPTATSPAIAAADSCPAASSAAFDLIPIDGGFYKSNALTDENADFRLSLIGYAPTDAQLALIDLPGGADAGAPRLNGVFEPNRVPDFTRAYKRYDWNWNESAPPPYGERGGLNNDDQAPVAVIDFRTSAGEKIHIPERGATIWNGDVVAMVLYAGPQELTLVYQRQDTVGEGYVVHMTGFCVDPNLVAAYRAQLENGKRKTGQLPGLRNNQPIGTALSDAVTIAIRDRARFLDPRSRKDWW